MNSLCRRVVLVALLIEGAARADQLYLIRPNGEELRSLGLDSACRYGSPDWSPDGRSIAYDTWPADGGYDTVTVAVATITDGAVAGEPTALVDGAMPSWSPDGKQLVCHTYNPNEIVVCNADGSGREAILPQWGSPRWSPQVREILTCRRGGVASYDLATGAQRLVLTDYSTRLGFSISPNGKRLCVVRQEGGLGVATYDPGLGVFSTRPRLDASYVGGHTSWSPDGARVVVTAQRRETRETSRDVLGDEPLPAGPSRLFVLAVDGNDPPVEVPGVPRDWDCSDADWSPAGDWIVFRRHH